MEPAERRLAEGKAVVDEGLAEIGAWVRQNTPGTSMLTAEGKAQVLPALSKVMLGLMKIGITNFKEVVREAKAKLKEAFPKLWNKILPEDFTTSAQHNERLGRKLLPEVFRRLRILRVHPLIGNPAFRSRQGG